MAAVWMRVVTALRARWRAWAALALAFGVAGGAATAAAAGARRTGSAYPRFVEEFEAYHVITGGLGSDSAAEVDRLRNEISRLPQVEKFAHSQFVADQFALPSGVVVGFPEAFVGGDITGAEFFTVNRAKVLQGRMFDPAATDEAIVDFVTSERMDLKLNDRVEILLLDPESFEPTIRRPVRIVGITMVPGAMPSVGQVPLTGISISPAFMRANARNLPPNEDAPSVRLRGGNAQIPEFVAAASKIAPNIDIPVTLPRHVAGVRKTLRFDVSALWILSALLGLAALVILGQALARQITLEEGDHPSLRALGMSRGQLIAADLLRAAGVGVVGAAVAVLVAFAASPLTPRGLVRIVEPDPGLYADWTAMSAGAAATATAAVLVAILPAIGATRRVRAQLLPPSRIASALARTGVSPTIVTGVRLAFESGRGTRAVPVRATILGVAVALTALLAAGTFTESLNALIGRPELYGFGWDVFAGTGDSDADARVLAADPDIVAKTRGGYANAVIAGKQVLPLVYEPGPIGPTMLEGRAPRTADEIALGTGLLRSLRLKIGGTIMVEPAEGGGTGRAKPYTIVGRTVVPPVFFQQLEPGESTAMTLAGALRLDPRESEDFAPPHLIRYRPGTDVRAKVDELRRKLPGLFVGQIRAPGAELSALSRSASLPVVLTIVLLLAAVGTLAHTMGSSVRKRRHDLAIMKTLGFVSRQVRATVAWKASALVVTALVIGIPAGIMAGRWAWVWFADTLGVVADPVAPIVIGAVVVPLSTIALANIIAALPARSAARTQAAVVLRTE